MSRSKTAETLVRLYDDKNGDYIQIAPDRDGLDLLEVIDSSNNASLVFDPLDVDALTEAMKKVADDILRRTRVVAG